MSSKVVPPGSEHSAILHGLARRRGELDGVAQRLRAQLGDVTGAIAHIDATIRLFNPDVRIEAIKPKRAPSPHAAGYGEVTGAIYDVLREATEPLAARELAAVMIAARGLDQTDTALETLMTARVRASLRPRRKRGEVRAVQMRADLQGWVWVGGLADRTITAELQGRRVASFCPEVQFQQIVSP